MNNWGFKPFENSIASGWLDSLAREEWTCIGVAVLFILITGAMIIGRKTYSAPFLFSQYGAFIVLNGWLLAIMVRDTRHWRSD